MGKTETLERSVVEDKDESEKSNDQKRKLEKKKKAKAKHDKTVLKMYDSDEDSVMSSIKNHLSAINCDLQWFDDKESDGKVLVSLWVKAQLARSKFENKMSQFKTISYEAHLKTHDHN